VDFRKSRTTGSGLSEKKRAAGSGLQKERMTQKGTSERVEEP